MSTSVEAYIQKKGWRGTIVQEKHGPQMIMDCPICDTKKTADDRPFYISMDTGKWNTYCCNKSGNLVTLQKMLRDYVPRALKRVNGSSVSERIKVTRNRVAAAIKPGQKGYVPTIIDVERWHQQLLETPEVLSYMTETRGLSIEAIKHFKLGAFRRDGYTWLAIPTIVNGELCMLKCRNLQPGVHASKKWKRFAGMRSVLFGTQDLVESASSVAYVAEAELDAIAAWDLGLRPACASSLGANVSIPDDWKDLLAPFDSIYLMYDQLDKPKKDGEQQGDIAAESAAKQLGTFRCYRTIFPAHDVNDWLTRRPSSAEVSSSIEQSIPYNTCTIETLYEASVRESTVERAQARSTGYPPLDELLGGGHRDGEWTLFMADTSIGKTTFSTDMGRRYARLNGCGVLYWPIEGGPVGIIRKVWCQELGGFWRTVKANEPHKFADMVDSLKDLPFYIYSAPAQSREEVRGIISHFARMGGKLFIIDHFHHLIRPEVHDDKQERVVIDKWISFIAEVCKEFNIHAWVIAHPKEPMTRRETASDSKTDISFEPDLHHFKGSSAGKQDVDNFIVITRKRTKGRDSPEERAELVATKIITKKVRNDDGREGNAFIAFHKKSQRYLTMAEGQVTNDIAPSTDPTSTRYDTDVEDDWFSDPIPGSGSVH